MKKKTYLVTGGAGFLGSALVKRLASAGHHVRVLDNLSRGHAKRLAGLQGDIEFVKADIRNYAAVSKAVRGVDSVCHLAFVNGTEFFYSRPDWVLDVGVKGMMNVVDACVEHGVGELILASSSEVYQTPPRVPTDETAPLSIPDPMNPRYSYAAGKIISEIIALNYGIRRLKHVVVFRPHNVYGPDMGREHVIPQFAMRLKKMFKRRPDGAQPFPIQGTGRQTRSFIYIEDFTDGLMQVIRKGKHRQIYHIGTTEQVPISRLAQMTAGCFGRRIRVVAGKPAEGGTLHRCPDIKKLERLGFRQKYPLVRGLEATVRWYRAND